MILSSTLLSLALSSLAILPRGQEPIALGDRLELLVDRHLIERSSGLRLEAGAIRDEGAVFLFDRPWDGPFSGYATVIQDGARYLLYYRGLPRAGGDGSELECTCVALSDDGVRWTRPDLEQFAPGDQRPNNVVLADAAPVTHNFAPFLDSRPGVEEHQRFKGLGGNEHSGLVAYTSADGLRWVRMQAEPVFRAGVFDSQNVSFWSEHEQCYVCYFRTWSGGGYRGYRTVSRTTSRDFLEWTEPELMVFRGAPQEHIYTNQPQPYFRAPHQYIGIAARFMPGRQVLSTGEAERLGVDPGYFRDCSDAVLLTSRGGNLYDRELSGAFLRPGIGLENWVSRSNYPACGVVRTGPREMSFYVNQNYAQPTAELRRYSLRLDGLASLRAGREPGELLTRALTFSGDTLVLNMSTSAAGELRVELQGMDGAPLEGFGLEACIPQIGNELERRVSWRRGDSTSSDLSEVAGSTVRLRISMSDADLFSLRFVHSSPAATPR